MPTGNPGISRGSYANSTSGAEVGWRRLYNAYHYEANSGNILTLDIFKQIAAQNCHYCNVPAPRMNSYGNVYRKNIGVTKERWEEYFIYANGIDKIVPGKSYADLSNLVPCCKTCNFMKGKFSYIEFLASIERISNYQRSLLCQEV